MLGKIVRINYLPDLPVLEDFKLFGSADATSKWEDSAKTWVFVWWRVRDSKRAIDAMAVLKRRIKSTVILIVAWLAHVMSSKAAEKCCRAAVHALPVDLDCSVLRAFSLTSTDFLQKAILTKQVFLFRRLLLLIGHLLLAVNETAKVRFLASVALVDGASLVGKFLRTAIVISGLFNNSRILKDALLFGVDESQLFCLFLEANERTKHSSDRPRKILKLNLLLAARA